MLLMLTSIVVVSEVDAETQRFCTNHPLLKLYRLDAVPDAQTTVSKHCCTVPSVF